MQSKIVKKVLSGILSVSLMLQMGMPVAFAENGVTSGLVLTDSTNTDVTATYYDASADSLKINASGTYTLSMAQGKSVTTTNVQISGSDRINVTLKLNGVNLTRTDDTPMLSADNADVTLDLNGTNNTFANACSNYNGNAYVLDALRSNATIQDSSKAGALNLNGGIRVTGNLGFLGGTVNICDRNYAMTYLHYCKTVIDGAVVNVSGVSNGNSGIGKCGFWRVADFELKSGTLNMPGFDANGTDKGSGVDYSNYKTVISGGTLVCRNYGGNITVNGGNITADNLNGNKKVEIPYSAGAVVKLDSVLYNTKDISLVDGKIPVWLATGKDHEITVGNSMAYSCTWDSSTSSFAIKETIYPTVKITQNVSTDNKTLIIGSADTVDLSVTAEKISSDDTNTINYQWYENGIQIAGAVSNSYKVLSNSKSSGDYNYYCKVSCGAYSVNSSTCMVQIRLPKPKIASVTIGGTTTEYEELSTAFQSVGTNQTATIKLLQDIDFGSSPDSSMSKMEDNTKITLDLNGHSIQGSSSSQTTGQGMGMDYSLTIIGPGTIQNTGNGCVLSTTTLRQPLTIKGEVKIKAGNNKAIGVEDTPVVIDDGAVIESNNVNSGDNWSGVIKSVSGNVTINGGTIKNTNSGDIIYAPKGAVIVNGGTISGSGAINSPNTYFSIASEVKTTGNAWFSIANSVDPAKGAISYGANNTTTYDGKLYSKKGETITFTLTPINGAVIAKLPTVSDGSTDIAVTKTSTEEYGIANKPLTFSFTMPSKPVSIAAAIKLPNTIKIVGSGISKVYDGTARALSTTKDEHFTWNGTGTATIDGYYTDANGTVPTTIVNSGAASDGGAPVNVGTYYAKVTVSGDDANWDTTAYIPFTIVQSGTTFDGSIKTYKDNAEINTFNYGDTITVKVTPKATGKLPGTEGVTGMFSAPTDNKMALYVGNTKIAEANADLNGVYTMTYHTKAKNLVIGSNTITAKYVGNNNAADHRENVTVTLNKKAITSAVVNTLDASASKEYNGTNSFTGVALTTFTGVESDDTVKATADGTVTDVNVGKDKAFTATSVTLDGEHQGYYSLDKAVVNGNVSITQAAATGVNQQLQVVKGLEKEYTFDLSKLLPDLSKDKSFGNITYTVGDVNTDNVFKQRPANSDIKDGKITLKVANVTDKDKISTVQIKVASKNYKDFTANLTLKTIDKTPLTVEAVFTGGTYKGKPYDYTGTPTFKNSAETLSGITYTTKYAGRDGTTYQESETAPTNAGTYKLIISVSADNENYTGEKEIPFTISKKEITVKADDKSIYVGEAIPKKGELTYKVTGLVGSDALTTVPSITLDPKAESTKEGTFTISITDAKVSENYTVVMESGTLKITKKPYTPPVTDPNPTPAPEVVPGKVIDENGKEVKGVDAKVTTEINGTKTVEVKSSEAVLMKQPDGSISPLKDITKLGFSGAASSSVTLSSDGNINIKGLANGTETKVQLTYDLGNGQRISIGCITVKVSDKGEVSLSSSLIDPYGTITDSSTGEAISGVNVTLYYANTERNKANGKTPDTVVSLPIIEGFKPNDNKNPQISDALGSYGFMVFPTTDYYIVATKDGYNEFKSPTIPVEQDIVKLDIKMNKPSTGLNRLSGLNRIDTAIEIAKASYTGKLSNVILATADGYSDALAGSVLAYKLNAPILLVGSSAADQEKVLAYIKANMDSAGNVYILGGTGVVSSTFEANVAASGFKNITRLGGANRYETSLKIAEKLDIKLGSPVVLAYGEDYPDALSISSTAAVMQYPILLVQKNGMSDAVKKKLAEIKPIRTYIIGLEGVISTTVEDQVAQATGLDKGNIVRIGGQDRYETSLAIAKYFGLNGQNICIATGNNYPDAIAGSVYAANSNSPIILADRNLSENTINYLNTRKMTGATIFGGAAVVSKDVEKKLSELIVK